MSNERILATGDIADFDFTVVKMEAQSIMRFWCRCQSIFENIGLWGSFAGGLHFNIWDPGDVLVKILAWSESEGLTDGSTKVQPWLMERDFQFLLLSCKQNKFSLDWWQLIQRDLCYMVDFPPAPVRGSRSWRPTWNGETESASRRQGVHGKQCQNKKSWWKNKVEFLLCAG